VGSSDPNTKEAKMIRRTLATLTVIAAFGVAAGTAAADAKQPTKVQTHEISIVHTVDVASPVLMK
jgi:hypothetical protein